MKKVFFDTSALVAALLQQHPHHIRAFPPLLAVHQGKLHGVMTTHGFNRRHFEALAPGDALVVQP